MPSEELAYDFVSGVSIGSVNASVFALFAPGEEREAADYITSFYDGTSSSDIFEIRSWPWIKAFTENSLADTTKLKDMLTIIFADKPFKRKLSFISSDIKSGQSIFFDETIPIEDRVQAVISSTSIPFAFPP